MTLAPSGSLPHQRNLASSNRRSRYVVIILIRRKTVIKSPSKANYLCFDTASAVGPILTARKSRKRIECSILRSVSLLIRDRGIRRALAQVHLAYLLPNHFVRLLVFPESHKNRLTQTIIPRPLRKFYLADHHRFDQTATLHFRGSQSSVPTTPTSRRKVKKGTFINPNFD